MKRAFVIRLTLEAEPANGKFEGRVEEVDTGRTAKFLEVDDFLAFLQKCLDQPPPVQAD